MTILQKKYTDSNRQQELFGDREITTAESRDPNPCVRLHGRGPEKNCGQCAHLIAHYYGCRNKYFKCSLRKNTHGAATDHRVRWNACGKFEAEK